MEMTTDLAPSNTTEMSSELVNLTEKAARFADASMSNSTKRKYRTAWRQFSAWCSSTGFASLPTSAEAVALYITHRVDQGRRVSTLEVDLAAIACAHRLARVASPTGCDAVKVVIRGIRRELGTRPTRKKKAITVDQLRRMVEALPDTNRGVRDHAVLVLGFASACRRSELAGLAVEDVEKTNDGLRVVIRRSKTDQEGRGRVVGLPWGSHPSTCPVRVLLRWLERAGISEGPLFRTVDRTDRVGEQPMSTRAISRAVKRAGDAIGLDPETLGGHSLRAGFATAAAKAGASERAIARQTGHRSMAVLRGYIREGTLWEDNAAAMLGL